MFWKKTKKEKQIKSLSEKEIQNQLYGKYLGRGEHKVEVMDSSAIVEHKDERPIEEKYDAKIKKEFGEELENLRAEFKHLKGEVNRLRKQREALERAEVGIKLPFLKTRHLVVIGSIVVLSAIILTSILAVRFMFAKVSARKTVVAQTGGAPSKTYTIQAYTTSKKEDADNVLQLLFSKGFPATAKEVKTPLGKTQYVIYVGEYLSKDQANATLQKLRKEREFKDSLVRMK